MAVKIHKKLAKSISYGGKRDLKTIKYIVIHYTGGNGDTAAANTNYFATSNTRQAGAHFFVDKKGDVWKSINMNRIAWSVGGKYSPQPGGGSYYGKCTNTNSVSIELCDCSKNTNWIQMKTTRALVKYIQKHCPNAKTIIRHWDVNNKICPAPMVGKNNKMWTRFHSFLNDNCKFSAKVIKDAPIRSSAKKTLTNKIGVLKKGSTVEIVKLVGNWARLKKKDAKGRYKYIALSKIQEI